MFLNLHCPADITILHQRCNDLNIKIWQLTLIDMDFEDWNFTLIKFLSTVRTLFPVLIPAHEGINVSFLMMGYNGNISLIRVAVQIINSHLYYLKEKIKHKMNEVSRFSKTKWDCVPTAFVSLWHLVWSLTILCSWTMFLLDLRLHIQLQQSSGSFSSFIISCRSVNTSDLNDDCSMMQLFLA